MSTVECGVCHRMVPADTVTWCFTSDEEGEYAVCLECESGPLVRDTRGVCCRELPGGTREYPHDVAPLAAGSAAGEEFVGFMAITSPCRIHPGGGHVQVDGWQVITTRGAYWVDNAGTVYRERVVHGFGATERHGYGVDSDCLCGRNFPKVRGLREHLTKARANTP